jgi:hypothetical protein
LRLICDRSGGLHKADERRRGVARGYDDTAVPFPVLTRVQLGQGPGVWCSSLFSYQPYDKFAFGGVVTS